MKLLVTTSVQLCAHIHIISEIATCLNIPTKQFKP